MINSANTFELDILPSQIVPPEKSNSNISKVPQSNQNNSYYSNTESFTGSPMSNTSIKTKDLTLGDPKKRVQVQLVQTFLNVQSNHWKSKKMYNPSAMEQQKGIPNDNCNDNDGKESAFNECKTAMNLERNNNNCDKNKNFKIGHNNMGSERHVMPTLHRTEDQENAFRRIEDVHNYAKLNRFSFSNGSSNSSSIREDDDEDLSDNDMDHDQDADVDADINYENYYIQKKKSKESTESINVDVESVQADQAEIDKQTVVAPDHHARRPMNAFLIFCKRHRAIVKEKYKSLENRAITKILGDWWASLDANEKKCFTNLAQQNKDAFFSANPNFKWYKLPAPPLRTLSTRPTNADRSTDHEPFVDNKKSILENQQYGNSCGKNYFKLADEAQMGELSSLFQKDDKNAQNSLQQTLSDTTVFFNSYLQQPIKRNNETNLKGCKRLLPSGNSFSSTSSEDDFVPKRKTSRSCKGRIYQELINSGQIAAVAKKAKQVKVPTNSHQTGGQMTCYPQDSVGTTTMNYAEKYNPNSNTQSKVRSVSESDSVQTYELANFDLDEKIKELPALSLEAYLQQKRSTKKKKKFNSKKRNSNSTSSNKSASSVQAQPTATTTSAGSVQSGAAAAAVGSQKRKARKESITRRDVNAIEKEVASILSVEPDFTTINGCYYFNERPIQQTVAPTSSCPSSAAASYGATLPASSNLNEMLSSPTSDLLILAEVAANRTELFNK